MADLNEISHNFYQFSYNSYLAEIKNSDKPEEHHFPSETAFFEDFSNKVNAAYNDISRNYPPEVAKYIYESMLFNLNRYSQNPAQCHIIDSSTGSINYTNLQANSKRVVEALQAKYPDKFVEVNAVKEEISVKDGVDFSKPEETNKYFDNLYKGLSECKNREEKINYIKNNFDLSLENMSEREKDEVISKFETRQKIREIKSTLDKDKISKENLDLTSEQIDELLEDKAAEQFAIENKKDIETTKQINNTMIEFENTKQEIEKFKQGLLTCNNQDERKDILDEIAKLEELSESIKTNLGLTDNEIIKINQNIEDTHDELDKDENLLNLI